MTVDKHVGVDWSCLQLHIYIDTVRGEVEEFFVSLEYNLQYAVMQPDDWCEIARFDHNPSSPAGHDITQEGLHLDLLNMDGSKHRVKTAFPAMPANHAPKYCREFFERRGEAIAEHFERRENINGHYRS